tara:strand:- start:114 stop:2216 length:2103 start_codon:yes stop_codon:yes gene_type:complete
MYSRRTAKRETTPTGRRVENVTVEIKKKTSQPYEQNIAKTGQLTLTGEQLVERDERKIISKVNLNVKTIVLKNKASWKKIFHTFDELYGVTYMSSPEYLLSLFQDQGFEKVELLIGHGLVEGFKQKLDGNVSAIDFLYSHVEDESLVVYGTKATNHSKLYILKKPGTTRVIIGSPNLSFTAEGSRQREICAYWDIEENDEVGNVFLEGVMKDYNSMLDEGDRILFMSDLKEQILEDPESDRVEQFQLWTRNKQDSESVAIRAMFSQIQGQAFNESVESENAEIHITIPEVLKKSQKKFLSTTFGAKVTGNRASIPIQKFLDHRNVQGTIPMEIDELTGEIKFGIHGKIITLPQEISKSEIEEGLNDIERFINTVDRGICAHPESVKMMLFETILFAFNAPFVNHLHKEKMRVSQIANRRGPKHLLLYGPGGNGKTVIGRYLNFLLTRNIINPISAKQFAKKDWENLFRHIQIAGSSYPVIVDDIKVGCFSGKRATLEGFVKSHWEENWKKHHKYPVFILNTNHEDLEEWAKSRIRRLELNIKHRSKADDMKILSELMSRENFVFAYFAKKFISELVIGVDYSEDELLVARKVMAEIYREVGRDLPQFFPTCPPEEIYDLDAISCYDKKKFGLIKERKAKGGIRIEFSSWKSLHNFRSRLPPEVNSLVDDNKLVITNPRSYKEFMKRGRPKKKSLFSRNKD